MGAHNAIDDWPGRLPNEPLSLLINNVADTDYFKTLAIPLVAGNNFVGNFGVDSFSVILNEAAVRRMRLKDPVGQTITWSTANMPPRLKIIGVAKDMLTKSPFTPAEPTMFVYQPGWTYTLTYRLAPNVNTQVAMEKLKTIFQKNDPAQPFSFHFVSDRYASQFELGTIDRQAGGDLCSTGDLYLLSGIVWAGGLHGGTADKGGGHPESAGCDGLTGPCPVVKGLCTFGGPQLSHRIADSLLFFTSMVAGVLLQGLHRGRSVCVLGAGGTGDHAADDKFPGAESSIDEPYKKFENRIKISYAKSVFQNGLAEHPPQQSLQHIKHCRSRGGHGRGPADRPLGL